MIEFWYFLYYAGLGGVILLTALGAGIGGGLASMSALEAIARAPLTRAAVGRALIVGLALIETGSIIGIVMGVLLLQQSINPEDLAAVSIAQLGIMLALGIVGLVVGIGGAGAVTEAMQATARQPFFAPKIFNLMLLTQSVIQTPIIFSFFISFVIYAQLGVVHDISQAVRMMAGGLCMGIGSIGPSWGLARFARAALKALGINREIYAKLVPFSFISQAIIETPLIFALLTSMIILLVPGHASEFLTMMAAIGSALVTGIGTLSPGLSSGAVAAAACNQMALFPQEISLLSRISVLVQGLIDTAAIYALLIAIIILMMR